MKEIYREIGRELTLGKLLSTEVIQSLWSGYGELVRLLFERRSLIVKHINLSKSQQHPQGWNTSLSHKRKLHSYRVEVNWYSQHSIEIDERCRTPRAYKWYQRDDEYLLVMEDLATLGLGYTTQKASLNHIKSSLRWLANFHAKYMGVRSEFIWEIGTYWHLDTRPDELEVLEDLELKSCAKTIDEMLKSSRYQTILHGDAKLANFCFNADATKCAAVDFQYIGHGCGMKDVVYFMSSCIEPDECREMQEWVLERYFKELHTALKFYRPDIDALEVEEEYRRIFSIAWADFLRFLKGWNPHHYKINSYSEELTSDVLKSLR